MWQLGEIWTVRPVICKNSMWLFEGPKAEAVAGSWSWQLQQQTTDVFFKN